MTAKPPEEKAPAKKNEKMPTARKRIIQSKKRKARNRAATSEIQNMMSSLKSVSEDKKKDLLKKIYSLADKGAKKGILKKNRAARIKTRASKLYPH